MEAGGGLALGDVEAGGGGAALGGAALDEVSVTFTDDALGMDLSPYDRNGVEMADAEAPMAYVLVKSVKPGGQAAASKKVVPGLAIQAVNDSAINAGITFKELVIDRIGAGRPVTIMFGPPPPTLPSPALGGGADLRASGASIGGGGAGGGAGGGLRDSAAKVLAARAWEAVNAMDIVKARNLRAWEEEGDFGYAKLKIYGRKIVVDDDDVEDNPLENALDNTVPAPDLLASILASDEWKAIEDAQIDAEMDSLIPSGAARAEPMTDDELEARLAVLRDDDVDFRSRRTSLGSSDGDFSVLSFSGDESEDDA